VFLPSVFDIGQAFPTFIVAILICVYSLYIHVNRKFREGMRILWIVPFFFIVSILVGFLNLGNAQYTIAIIAIDLVIAGLYISWFIADSGSNKAIKWYWAYGVMITVVQILPLVIGIDTSSYLRIFRLAATLFTLLYFGITLRRAALRGDPIMKLLQVRFFVVPVGFFLLMVFNQRGADSLVVLFIEHALMLGYFYPVFLYDRETYKQATQTIDVQTKTFVRLFNDLREISTELLSGGTTVEDRDKNVGGVLERLLESVVTAVKPDGVAVFLLDRFNENLEVSNVYGLFPPVVEIPSNVLRAHVGAVEDYLKSVSIKPGETFLWQVFKRREPLFRRTLSDRDRKRLFFDVPTRGNIESLLVLPLYADKKNFGVMTLVRNVTNKPFDMVDVSQSEFLSRYVSLAIDNRNTYVELFEKQQIEQEITIAGDIQKSLLPTPDMMSSQMANVEVLSVPLKGVSGDYVDIISLPESNAVIAMICDVAGKGIPAALLMMLIRSVLHMIVKSQKIYDPGRIITEINVAISEAKSIDRFATMKVLYLQKQDNNEITLDFASAGHHPLIAATMKAGEKPNVEELDTEGIPVGIDSTVEYTQVRHILQGGDYIALYTDGVSEIRKGNTQEEYGVGRMSNILEEVRAANVDPSQAIMLFREDMKKYAAGSKQHDDQTFVLIKLKEQEA